MRSVPVRAAPRPPAAAILCALAGVSIALVVSPISIPAAFSGGGSPEALDGDVSGDGGGWLSTTVIRGSQQRPAGGGPVTSAASSPQAASGAPLPSAQVGASAPAQAAARPGGSQPQSSAPRLLDFVPVSAPPSATGAVEPPAAQAPGEEARGGASTSTPATSASPPPPAPAPADEPELSLWKGAGAFVWNEDAVSPEQLAATLRANGFAWVALRLHDGVAEDPVHEDWIARFRRAGGPVVGGWGVLRDQPEADARLAAKLVRREHLAFYIANAEAEYGELGDTSRSRRFVGVFRRELPELPAALSTTCGPGGVDIASWKTGRFSYLPQAYVNEFGARVAPARCVEAATGVYARSAVHPTIGTYASAFATGMDEYARLLAEAGTVGFSVYLAETNMTPERWRDLGRAIGERGIAT